MDDQKDQVSDQSDSKDSVLEQDQKKSDTVTREAYERLLAEAKKAKSEQRALAEKLKAEETKKLSEQSQWKELADKYKQELDAEKQTKQKIAKAAAKRTFSQAVKEEAQALGAHPTVLDDLLKVGDWTGIDIEESSTDEDLSFSVDKTKVREALVKLQKDKPIYFTKSAQAPKDVALGQGLPNGKSNKEMSREEILEQLKKVW
jgi:hypothetical protein